MTTANFIAKTARSFIGAPYAHATAGPDAFDDFGLVQFAAGAAGVKIDRPASPPWHARRPCAENLIDNLDASRLTRVAIETSDDIREGDVLAFRVISTGPANHVGVFIGRDAEGTPRFAFALAGRAVRAEWLCRWWLDRLVAVYRLSN